MKYSALLVALIGLFALAKAQNGVPCHASFFQFTPRHRLDIPMYMGDWYMHEIASSDIGNFPEPDFRCAKRHLSLPDEEDILNIEITDTFNWINNNSMVTDIKDASVNDTRSPFSSMWMLNHTGEDGTPLTTQVIVLFADLEFGEWSVVYSCSIRGPQLYRYEVVMAMTRSRTIDPRLRQFLKALMVGQGFRIGDHYPINQTNCTDNDVGNFNYY